MKKITKLTVAFLAIMFIANNSSYAQTPLPDNNLIDAGGDYNLDRLIAPSGTGIPSPTRIKVDISKVNYFSDVRIGTSMTNPIWGGLPTGYPMPNGYNIYSSYIKPLVPGPYDKSGNQGIMTSTIQFIDDPLVTIDGVPSGHLSSYNGVIEVSAGSVVTLTVQDHFTIGNGGGQLVLFQWVTNYK